MPYLERGFLVPDCLLEAGDVLLLVVDLLLRLGEVRLQLVVRVRRLGDPLLQRRVRVGPRRPHVVGARRDQVVHVGAQPLRGGPSSWKKLRGRGTVKNEFSNM